jgi:predicted nucleotidyltransferase
MARNPDEVARIARQALDALSNELEISAAILFGSYVEGTPHESSDIDLAVFTPDASRPNVEEKARLQLRVQPQCANDLELHLYSDRALAEARPTNFCGYLLTHGVRLI